jgi:hypothetical protein
MAGAGSGGGGGIEQVAAPSLWLCVSSSPATIGDPAHQFGTPGSQIQNNQVNPVNHTNNTTSKHCKHKFNKQ